MEKSNNLILLRKQLRYICELKTSIEAELEEEQSTEKYNCDNVNVPNEERMIELKSRIDVLEEMKNDISKRIEDASKEVEKSKDGKTVEEKELINDKVEGLNWWLEKVDPESANMVKKIILASMQKESYRNNMENKNSKKNVSATVDDQKLSNSNSSKDKRGRSSRQEERTNRSRSRSSGQSFDFHRGGYGYNERGRSSRPELRASRDRNSSRSRGRSSGYHRGSYDYNERGRSSRNELSASRDRSISRSSARNPVSYRSNPFYNVKSSHPQQHEVDNSYNYRASFNQQLPFGDRPRGRGWKGNSKRSHNSLARAALYKQLRNIFNKSENTSD